MPPHLRDNQHSEDLVNQDKQNLTKEIGNQINDTISNIDSENIDATNVIDGSIADDDSISADVNKDEAKTVNKTKDSTGQEVNESKAILNVAADSSQDTSAPVNKTDDNIEITNHGQNNDNNDFEPNDAEEEIELDDIDFDQSDSDGNEEQTENSDAKLISEKME